MNVELSITEEEAQTILNGLSVLPYRDVFSLIPKIIEQANSPRGKNNGNEPDRADE